MFVALIVFHVLVCVALIIVVLLQSSKGEGLAGSAFGGGGLGGAVFGGRGAGSFLSKATTVLAIVFMINCVGLAFMSANRSGRVAATDEGVESVVTREAQKAREQAMQQQQQQQQPQSSDSLLNLDVAPVTPQGDTGGN